MSELHLLERNSKTETATITVADIFDNFNKTSGNNLTIEFCISIQQIIRPSMQTLALLDTNPDCKHRISVR